MYMIVYGLVLMMVRWIWWWMSGKLSGNIFEGAQEGWAVSRSRGQLWKSVFCNNMGHGNWKVLSRSANQTRRIHHMVSDFAILVLDPCAEADEHYCIFFLGDGSRCWEYSIIVYRVSLREFIVFILRNLSLNCKHPFTVIADNNLHDLKIM